MSRKKSNQATRSTRSTFKSTRESRAAEKKLALKNEAKFQKKLKSLRAKIDEADRTLIAALAKRSAIVEKIGLVKKKYGEPLRQKSRWKKLLQDRTRRATRLGVDRQLILAVFECIQKESIARQARAKSKGRKK